MIPPLRTFLLGAFLCVSVLVSAQDPFFSQFYANRVYLNPAYAGLEAGTQLILNYRDQWFGLPDASSRPFQGGFRTYNVTLNQRIPCLGDMERVNIGVAGSLFQDETGVAPLRTTGGGLAAAFEYALMDPNRRAKNGLTRLDFRLGTQVSLMQSTLVSGHYFFAYQVDPVVGVTSAPQIIDLSNGPYTNVNLGGLVRGAWKHGLHDYTIFTVGASVSNVNEPVIAFDPERNDASLPRRTTMHLGFTRSISSMRGTKHYTPTSIAPQFRWDTQQGGKMNLYTLGTYMFGKGYYFGAFYQFNALTRPAIIGGSHIGGRNSNALIFSWGLDARTLLDVGRRWRDRATGWIVGFSYDVPVSGVNATASLGTVEVNCRIMLADLKSRCRQVSKNELYPGAKCPVSF